MARAAVTWAEPRAWRWSPGDTQTTGGMTLVQENTRGRQDALSRRPDAATSSRVAVREGCRRVGRRRSYSVSQSKYPSREQG